MLLALHGAMSADHQISGDAEIVSRLRSELGPSVPLVVTHDLHANVLPGLLQHVDGLSGYRTYPHVDQRDTGLRAAALLQRRLTAGKPRNWQMCIPILLVPQASSTFELPLAAIMDQMATAFPSDNECCASFFFVQPWLDFSPVATCITVTDFTGDDGVPEKMLELARRLWSIRHDFNVPWLNAEELTAKLDEQQSRPVLVSEAYDSPSGGATGDHSGLLRTVLPHAHRLKGCLFLIDPEAAAQATNAGAGAQVEMELGGKIDPRFSSPVSVRATVLHSSNGEFCFKGPAFHGLSVSMGRTATVAISGISVVIGTRAVFVIDPELYRSQGVEPAEQDFVGVKSPTLFRPAYKPVSENVVHFDMPGPCRGKLSLMPYRGINRPIFPLDEFDWQPTLADVQLCDGEK